MQKLAAVEEARRVMNEGKEWGIFHWLLEKRRVRAIADAGTAALDDLEKNVKARWSDDLRKAYRELDALAAVDHNPRLKRQYDKARDEAREIDPAMKQAAARVREADDIAYQARMDAEALFEEAERRLSGSIARRGAEKALEAYDLREKAIRKAEAANRLKARPGS